MKKPLRAFVETDMAEPYPPIPPRKKSFRDPVEIDLSSGPQPLPLTLMLRRIGHEAEDFVGGAEILHGVKALYKMYAAEFRSADMNQVYESLKSYPSPADRIPLKLPTAR